MSDKKARNVNTSQFPPKPEGFRKPIIGRKVNTPNMNSTMLAPLNKNQDANVSLYSFNSPVLKTDWGLECSLAYNSYLQSLMMNQLIEKAIVNFEILIDDQLTINGEILLKQKREQRKLHNTITNGELLKQLVTLVKNLNEETEQLLSLKEETGFEKHVDELIEIFQDASNRLYLKNMKLFEEDGTEEFVNSMKKCAEAMRIFKKCVQYNDGNVSELLSLLKGLENEGKGTLKKEKLVSDQLMRLTALCFKRVSQKFIEMRSNTEG